SPCSRRAWPACRRRTAATAPGSGPASPRPTCSRATPTPRPARRCGSPRTRSPSTPTPCGPCARLPRSCGTRGSPRRGTSATCWPARGTRPAARGDVGATGAGRTARPAEPARTPVRLLLAEGERGERDRQPGGAVAGLVADLVDGLGVLEGAEQDRVVAVHPAAALGVAGEEGGAVAGRPLGGAGLEDAALGVVDEQVARGVVEGAQHAGDVAQRGVEGAALLERLAGLALEVEHHPLGVGAHHLAEVVVAVH